MIVKKNLIHGDLQCHQKSSKMIYSWKSPEPTNTGFNIQGQKVMFCTQTETTVHILNSKRPTQPGIYL